MLKNKDLFKLAAVEEDTSAANLLRLLDKGYTTAKLIYGKGDCYICAKNHGMTRTITELLESSFYNAPIYEWTHVGCRCELEITGPGLDPISITAKTPIFTEEDLAELIGEEEI